MTDYKRDIREDIDVCIGLSEHVPPWGYEKPESGDRRFNLNQLNVILRFLDVCPPRQAKRSAIGHKKGSTYHYTRAMSKAVEPIVGKGVEVNSLGKDWNGFKRDDLRTIREAVYSYEPMGFPPEDDIAQKLFESSTMSEGKAKSEASRLISANTKHTEALSVGFTLDDVTVYTKQYGQVRRNQTDEGDVPGAV